MRRASPPPTPEQAARQFEILLRSKQGLEDLLALLPAGSTLDDARRVREAATQRGRRPCSFLDGPLGITRD